MAKGFRKSKLAFWGIMCLGVLLSVLLWIRDRNYPVYIPIIASTLSLLIGYFAACVVRNLIASIWDICTWTWIRTNSSPPMALCPAA